MTDIRILTTLKEAEAQQWNACFPNALEDYHFLRVVEEAGIANFTWRYIVALKDDVIIAAIPAFFTQYALDTTLEGAAKKLSQQLSRIFPRALRLKLACIGSPVTEFGLIGFHPSMAAEARGELLHTMMEKFEHYALAHGYALVALKDISANDLTVWDTTIERRSFKGVSSLPVAELAINFASMDDYFTRLSAATRKDMRRKLRSRDALRIEYRTALDDVMPRIMELYRATRSRADMQFEELTDSYFSNLLSQLGERALCVLYFHGDELLAANFLLKSGSVLLDKIFCMGERGRDFNLYFISWFTNIEYCLAHGLSYYQSGQAGYDAKVRLGSQLHPTTIYFKHRNRLLHRALRMAAPFLAIATSQEAA